MADPRQPQIQPQTPPDPSKPGFAAPNDVDEHEQHEQRLARERRADQVSDALEGRFSPTGQATVGGP
jgi:hypothetical protein